MSNVIYSKVLRNYVPFVEAVDLNLEPFRILSVSVFVYMFPYTSLPSQHAELTSK